MSTQRYIRQHRICSWQWSKVNLSRHHWRTATVLATSSWMPSQSSVFRWRQQVSLGGIKGWSHFVEVSSYNRIHSESAYDHTLNLSEHQDAAHYTLYLCILASCGLICSMYIHNAINMHMLTQHRHPPTTTAWYLARHTS